MPRTKKQNLGKTRTSGNMKLDDGQWKKKQTRNIGGA